MAIHNINFRKQFLKRSVRLNRRLHQTMTKPNFDMKVGNIDFYQLVNNNNTVVTRV